MATLHCRKGRLRHQTPRASPPPRQPPALNQHPTVLTLKQKQAMSSDMHSSCRLMARCALPSSSLDSDPPVRACGGASRGVEWQYQTKRCLEVPDLASACACMLYALQLRQGARRQHCTKAAPCGSKHTCLVLQDQGQVGGREGELVQAAQPHVARRQRRLDLRGRRAGCKGDGVMGRAGMGGDKERDRSCLLDGVESAFCQ